MNGDVVAQSSQFSLKDVEVVVAQIDLDAVCCYINNPVIPYLSGEKSSSQLMSLYTCNFWYSLKTHVRIQ